MDHQVRVCVSAVLPVKQYTLADLIRQLEPWDVHQALHASMIKGLNYSIEFRHPLRGPCVVSLLKNTSDIGLQLMATFRPLDDNLMPATVDAAPTFKLMSTYKVNDQRADTQVADFVRGFDQNVWLLTTALIMILAIMTTLSHRRLRTSWLETWTWITALILKQAGSLPLPLSLQLMPSLLLLQQVSMFFLTFYLTSMIKTESVTYGQPDLVDSIDDMMRLGVRPIVADGFFHVFKHTPDGSMLKRFTEAAELVGMDQTLVTRETQQEHEEGVVNGTEVMIEYESMILPQMIKICTYLRQTPGNYSKQYVWISHESDTLGIKMIPMRRSLDKYAQAIIVHRLNWISQHQLQIPLIRSRYLVHYVEAFRTKRSLQALHRLLRAPSGDLVWEVTALLIVQIRAVAYDYGRVLTDVIQSASVAACVCQDHISRATYTTVREEQWYK